MIRITDGEYLAVSENKMVEIQADTKEEARKIAATYYFDEQFVVCKIPSIIGYYRR